MSRSAPSSDGIRVRLLFPPMVFPHSPYLALPLLKACLDREGHRCEQEDLNLPFYHDFLGKHRLESIAWTLAREVAEQAREAPLTAAQVYRWSVKSLGIANARSAAKHIDEAYWILRDKQRFYRSNDYQWAIEIIDQALSALSAYFFPNEFSREGFRAAASPFEAEDICAFAASEIDNPFLEFYRSCGTSDTRWSDYEIVGISVAFPDQILAAFTLAKEIKTRSPETLVCCGGNVFTRVKDGIRHAPWVFNWFDAVVIGEGERPIVELAAALAEGRPWQNIRAVASRSNGEVRVQPAAPSTRGAEWPTPDFRGLPLQEYLSPDVIFPLLTFKGCSYGKCTFCDHHVNYQQLRARPPAMVAEDIRLLCERHGARRFNFVDEEMPPTHAKRIGTFLSEPEFDHIRWMGYAIYRDEWTPETWRLLQRSGCREMLFGFESGSQRILAKMKKQIDFQNVLETTRVLNELGIASRINVIVGFPGERESESAQSLDFFLDNADLFDVPGTLVAFHPFLMVRNSPYASSNEGKAVAGPDARRHAFSLHYDYDVRAINDDAPGRPIDSDQAYSLANSFSRQIERNARSSGYPLNRLHRFLFICKNEEGALSRPPPVQPSPEGVFYQYLEPMHTELITTRFNLESAYKQLNDAIDETNDYQTWTNFRARGPQILANLQNDNRDYQSEDQLYIWHAGRTLEGNVIIFVQPA